MQLNSLSTRLYKTFQTNPLRYIHIPLCIYWLLLFILTTIPTEKIPQFFYTQDKLEHFIAYLILSFLLSLSLHFQKKFKFINKNYLFFAIIFLVVYATLDEFHQILIPGRYCDIFDWITDIFGGLIGILISNYFLKFNSKILV